MFIIKLFETLALSREFFASSQDIDSHRKYFCLSASSGILLFLAPPDLWLFQAQRAPLGGASQICVMAAKSWHCCRTKRALALVQTNGRVSCPVRIYYSMFPLLPPRFILSIFSLSQSSNYNMLLSLINVLLLTPAFAHAIPQPGPGSNLGEAELDKLYPKCWVDVSTIQGKGILYNVPGRCKVKTGEWKKIFAHTLGIAGGCGKPLLFCFFTLNCDVFQATLS